MTRLTRAFRGPAEENELIHGAADTRCRAKARAIQFRLSCGGGCHASLAGVRHALCLAERCAPIESLALAGDIIASCQMVSCAPILSRATSGRGANASARTGSPLN